jgi:hypothetical protein
MFAWFRKSRRRRKLAPVVKILPWALTKAYGSADFYSPPQVRRAFEKLKLDAELFQYSIWAYCNPEDVASDLEVTEAERIAHRAELVELFELPSDFNVEDVRRLKIRSNWTPMEWWHSDPTLYSDQGGGSHHNS